jgi:hypothetical protein
LSYRRPWGRFDRLIDLIKVRKNYRPRLGDPSGIARAGIQPLATEQLLVLAFNLADGLVQRHALTHDFRLSERRIEAA